MHIVSAITFFIVGFIAGSFSLTAMLVVCRNDTFKKFITSVIEMREGRNESD